MPDYVESVNKIATFFREQVEDVGPQWKEKFERFVSDLEGASSELVRLYGLTSEASAGQSVA